MAFIMSRSLTSFRIADFTLVNVKNKIQIGSSKQLLYFLHVLSVYYRSCASSLSNRKLKLMQDFRITKQLILLLEISLFPLIIYNWFIRLSDIRIQRCNCRGFGWNERNRFQRTIGARSVFPRLLPSWVSPGSREKWIMRPRDLSFDTIQWI